MAKESLREHLNRKLKEKGTTLKAEKAKAKKYKSIAEAKKAKSLYYTDKNGKVMAAVYATDLKDKDGLKTSLRPKLRPTPKAPKPADKPVRPKTGPKEEVKRRVTNKNKNPDELNTEAFNSVKQTGRKGVSLTKEELKQMSEYYPRDNKNKGGMMKKKSAYKAGGMAMVTDPKTGKKIPAFAADGKGKMNKGGMAKKKPTAKMMHGGMAAKKKPTAKKMMAGGMAKKKPTAKKMMGGGSTGYMYGGMTKKKK